MKTTLTLLIALILVTISTNAQQGINYKALIKDGGGNVVASQSITIQFIIYESVALTNNVYQETHSPNTDANGIIIINIGEGVVDGGVYADVDWGADDHYLNVQINTGGGLVDMGTIQFMAVPYALSAANAATKIDELSDGKSDNDGSQDGSSVFFGINSGLNDDASNNKNVGVGFESLIDNTTGFNNTANGYRSLYNNTEGIYNTANGAEALYSNSSGSNNTANGTFALYSNGIGDENTANGYESLYQNTFGNRNTANGNQALNSNISGDDNTASGSQALFSNTIGDNNTASGYRALFSNTEGNFNSAHGAQALDNNTTGSDNTAYGYQALFTNTTGSFNTAIGYKSLFFTSTTGIDNTGTGYFALYKNTTGYSNSAFGVNSLLNNTTGNENTAVGTNALNNNTTGSNNTAVGFSADVPNGTASNQVRIGNTNVTSAGVQVAWTVTSDKRWKENIRDLPYGLEIIKQLKPVDYLRKNNGHKTREMGFIAQDLEALLAKVGYTDQGFLTKDDKGLMSLRYNDFIALLTKAIQEQQDIIEEQNKEIKSLSAEQQLTNNRLNKIEELLNTTQQ